MFLILQAAGEAGAASDRWPGTARLRSRHLRVVEASARGIYRPATWTKCACVAVILFIATDVVANLFRDNEWVGFIASGFLLMADAEMRKALRGAPSTRVQTSVSTTVASDFDANLVLAITSRRPEMSRAPIGKRYP